MTICPHCGQSLVRVGLSFREKQVVGLIKQAKANKEIAYELHVTEGTIKEYLFYIFKKVGVKNRTELALWATEHLPRPTARASSLRDSARVLSSL